jgi:hypothetical protein
MRRVLTESRPCGDGYRARGPWSTAAAALFFGLYGDAKWALLVH